MTDALDQLSLMKLPRELLNLNVQILLDAFWKERNGPPNETALELQKHSIFETL